MVKVGDFVDCERADGVIVGGKVLKVHSDGSVNIKSNVYTYYNVSPVESAPAAPVPEEIDEPEDLVVDTEIATEVDPEDV